MDIHTLLLAVGLSAVASMPSGAIELPDNVPETVAKISADLERRGFQIDAVVNHAAAADSVDLDLLPTQAVFFSAKFSDASLIRRGQSIALDLPLRFLVWEDDEGTVRVDTNEAGYLLDRHDLQTIDPRFRFLGSVLGEYGSADNGIRIVESTRSFDDTLDALLETLEGKGFRIPLIKDFAQRGWHWRSRLRPTTVVLFGNPNVGTPLMQNSRSIGLDLPQKMLVYEDGDGQVLIAYNDPFFLAHKHDVSGEDMRLGNIAGALLDIAQTAAGSLE